jgi:predicted dehydrogenase
MNFKPRREFLVASAATVGAFALSAELDPLAALPSRPASFGGPLEVGLVGCGRQGRAILAELAKMKDVAVVALADPIESRTQAAARRAAGARSYKGHAELLAGEKSLAAVFVATPTHLHRAPAVDAFAAGKHVWCESPLAATAEDARAIAAAARASGKLGAVGLQGRANPIYALARSFHKSGALRGLASLRAQAHKKTSWRFQPAQGESDGAANWRLDPAVSLGLEGEWFCQQADVYHWYLNEYPTRVRGAGSVRLHKDGRTVADTVALELEFASGLHLAWSGTLANSYEGTYESFCGEMATLRLAWNAGWMFKEADSPTQGWEVYANREQFHDEQGITLIADATKLAAQNKLKEGVGLPEPPLYYTLADFVAAIGAGKAPVCGIDEGLRAALVAQACHRAVVSGEAVALDPESFKGAFKG